MSVCTSQQIAVSQSIINSIQKCDIDGNFLYLPDRVNYTYGKEELASFKGFLNKYKAKWISRKQAFNLPFEALPFVKMVTETGYAPKPNPLAYHPTPKIIVDAILEHAGIRSSYDIDGLRILEPQAGSGAILDGIAEYLTDNTVLHTCELDPINQNTLLRKGYSIQAEDFLAYQPEHHYDFVLCNPPFSTKGDPLAYITHILHAISMLSPYGRLVAVVPSTFDEGDSERKAAFKELCYSNALFDLERFTGGMFDSTPVETSIIVLGGSKLSCPIIPKSLFSDYHNIFEERAHLLLANDPDMLLKRIPKLAESFSQEGLTKLVDDLIAMGNAEQSWLPESFRSYYSDIVRHELDRFSGVSIASPIQLFNSSNCEQLSLML